MSEFQIKYFSERLAEVAKRHGGNIGLAKKLGMTKQQIGNYTQHKKPTEPKINFLYKLVSFLQEDVVWLLTGENLNNTRFQELQKQMEEMQKEIDTLKIKMFDLGEENKELREENRELKERNEDLFEFGKTILINFSVEFSTFLASRGKRLNG